MRTTWVVALVGAVVVAGTVGCAGSDDTTGTSNPSAGSSPGAGVNAPGTPGGDSAPGSGDPAAPGAPPAQDMPGDDGSDPGAAEEDPLAGAAGTGPASQSPPAPGAATGPLDGDPARPLVAIPGIACGGVPNALAIAPANVEIAGRGVIVDYPCGKHEGARVVFILNLHGTMPDEGLKFYQHANFSAYRLVAPDASGVSPYNIVVVSPKTVAPSGQWGNGDGGVDQPYLLDLIDWTYDTFSQFQIEHLWVVGHSWGSGYTANFACLPQLVDRVQGVVLMSGPPALPEPSCASRLSVLGAVGENDLPGIVPIDLTPAAMAHGCGPRMELPDLDQTKITAWPCPAGTPFVYRNYYWVGIGHQVFPGDWAHEPGIDDLVDAILSVR